MMIDVRISLFAVVMLTGVLADVLMEGELTLPRRLFLIGQWAAISAGAVAVTPAPLTGYAATLAAVIGGGRVAAWALRAVVEQARVVMAARRILKRLETG